MCTLWLYRFFFLKKSVPLFYFLSWLFRPHLSLLPILITCDHDLHIQFIEYFKILCKPHKHKIKCWKFTELHYTFITRKCDNKSCFSGPLEHNLHTYVHSIKRYFITTKRNYFWVPVFILYKHLLQFICSIYKWKNFFFASIF